MHEKSASQLLLHLSDTSSEIKMDKDEIQHSELSTRREMVNLLDAEPLLDYLVQNGVLSSDEKREILIENDNVKQNILLLKLVETRPNGVKLFTNVLRQTGQHYLANLVDDGIRIKALSGSGYLSKSRHRGQVGLKISVKSMKLQLPTFKTVSELLHKDWISLEDIQMKLSSIKKMQSQSLRSSMVDQKSQRCSVVEPPEALPSSVEIIEESEDTGCCFCCCKSRKSKSTKTSAYIPDAKSEPNGHEMTTVSNTNCNAYTEGLPAVDAGSVVVIYQPTNKFSGSQDLRVDYIRNGHGSLKRCENSVENLRIVANSIQEKCIELFTIVSDSSAAVHINLVRYLEQELGVLVLDTCSGDYLDINCICTKPDHITQLCSDSSTGKLTLELERIVAVPAVLQPLGISGVKLEVEVNSDDVEVASQELA